MNTEMEVTTGALASFAYSVFMDPGSPASAGAGKSGMTWRGAMPRYFSPSTSRTVSASCWTEKGLARKETLAMSIDLRSCSSA